MNKDWAIRYLHFCLDLENAEKGEMNDLAAAEEQLIDEFYEDNGNYKKGFNHLMKYWDSISDEEKPKVDAKLKELGL